MGDKKYGPGQRRVSLPSDESILNIKKKNGKPKAQEREPVILPEFECFETQSVVENHAEQKCPGKNRFSLKQLFRSNSKKSKQNEVEEFFAGGETALIEDIYIPQIALLAISGVKADFLINKVEFIIGSSSHCDGRIQDIPGVSRSHFRILEHDGQEFIQDLGSLNGTFLNGKHLDRQAYPVYPGDIIHIAADVKFEVKECQ